MARPLSPDPAIYIGAHENTLLSPFSMLSQGKYQSQAATAESCSQGNRQRVALAQLSWCKAFKSCFNPFSKLFVRRTSESHSNHMLGSAARPSSLALVPFLKLSRFSGKAHSRAGSASPVPLQEKLSWHSCKASKSSCCKSQSLD